MFFSPTITATELLLPIATPEGETLDFSKESPKSPLSIELAKQARELKSAKEVEEKRVSRRNADGALHIASLIQGYANLMSCGSIGDSAIANSEFADLGIHVCSNSIIFVAPDSF